MSVTDEHRKLEINRLDLMIDQVQDMATAVKLLTESIPKGQTTTVIHKTQGMGAVGIVCAAFSFMCVLFLILGAIVFVPDIHDLKAWQDILRKDIARLQAGQQQLEKAR